MKRFFLFCIFVGSFLLIPVGFKRLTCGFKLAKMQLEMPFRSDWEVGSMLSREEMDTIFSQPYTYLDRGAQCYVFASEDGKYVIKFFRFDRKDKKMSSMQKINALFSASTLAYERAQEETGLLFLHLNQTEKAFPLLQVTGPLGQPFSLKLDNYRFAIQKRVRPFREALLRAYHASNPEEMEHLLDSFVSVLSSRIDKGIRNSDPAVSRNFGFLGKRAFEIDFGNYSENRVPKEKEMARYIQKLRIWLNENAPEWVSYLDKRELHAG